MIEITSIMWNGGGLKGCWVTRTSNTRSSTLKSAAICGFAPRRWLLHLTQRWRHRGRRCDAPFIEHPVLLYLSRRYFLIVSSSARGGVPIVAWRPHSSSFSLIHDASSAIPIGAPPSTNHARRYCFASNLLVLIKKLGSSSMPIDQWRLSCLMKVYFDFLKVLE